MQAHRSHAPLFPVRGRTPRLQRTRLARRCLAVAAAAVVAVPVTLAAQTASTRWVATWATSPEPLVSSQSSFNPPAPGLANNSVRQVLRVSLGGDTLRMRFTNEYTPSAVVINAASIAVSSGAGAIDTATLRFFRFDGKDSITMPANGSVWSDPLAFSLEPGAKVEITLHFGTTPASGTYPGITVHRGSRTIPRVLAGNHVAAPTFAGASTINQGSWVISSMEVRAPAPAAAVAILGNSITDGYGITQDSFTRWTDALTTNLLAHESTRHVGVLNAGIGAGAMVNGGVSTPGLQRYKRDLFDHANVKWIIVMLGVNDLGAVNNAGAATTVGNNLIAAYAEIADSARARGIRAYAATIMPFEGNGYYNVNSESARQTLNTWIRATDKYDAVVDFDSIMRDPADTTRLLAAYSNDWLHPNVAGYAFMGNAVDTALFAASTVGIRRDEGTPATAGYSLGRMTPAGADAAIRFTIPAASFVSLKVHAMNGREVAELAGRRYPAGTHTVTFRPGALPKGVYLYSLKAGGFAAARKMVISGR